MTKYILVSGGVISGIGKGVIASSTGLLLKMAGFKVTAIKIDPYMNIDAGTMKPTEHGEVYVLNDGGEVDLDLGNYERYLDVTLSRENNITTGKIYSEVIQKERRGDYLGKTVQIVPHVTTAIQDWIERVSHIPVDDTNSPPDICIVELGGTVGDIESAPFIEAMRQFQFRVGHENFALVHVSLVPDMHGEQKTKPTQATVRDLRGLGLMPDLVACRLMSSRPLETSTKAKISMFCHVTPSQVLGVHDVSSVYHVPMLLAQQGLVPYFRQRLGLDGVCLPREMVERGRSVEERWGRLTEGQERPYGTVTIVLVGKYTDVTDSYMSVTKSLEHAALRCNRKLNLQYLESSHLEPATLDVAPAQYHDAWRTLVMADGVLVPGGFGDRGTEGMILATKWAREQKKPFLGICYGFQLAVVEWARNVCGWTDAHHTEIDEHTPTPVVVYMPEISKTQLGGTMRLGLRATIFAPGTEKWSKLRKLYGNAPIIYERHRHRWEVNPAYVDRLQASGLEFIGKDEKGERMQAFEVRDHPYFVGLQAHPEFCTRPLNPSPPFLGLVAASVGQSMLEEQIVGQTNYRSPHPRPPPVDIINTAHTAAGEGKEANGVDERKEAEKVGVVQVNGTNGTNGANGVKAPGMKEKAADAPVGAEN